MRAVTHGDVVAAARAIRAMPRVARLGAVMGMIEKAHAADRFRKRFGRAHPLWGNGSLMAVALRCRGERAEPFPSDPGHLDAMATVIEAILAWRRRLP